MSSGIGPYWSASGFCNKVPTSSLGSKFVPHFLPRTYKGLNPDENNSRWGQRSTYSSLELKKGSGGNLFSPGVLHVKGGDDGLLLQVQQLTPPLPLQPLLVLSMLGRYIIQHNNIQVILHTTQLRTYFCI